jgi:predicted Zn-dependent peptidase
MMRMSKHLVVRAPRCGAALLSALVAGALLVAAPPSLAKKPGTAAGRTGLENLEKQVRQFSLPNGLDFIVLERHQAPVFSYMTVVGAGGASNRAGTTGLAHMMEHMAFKGTPLVGTSDYAKERPLLDAEDAAWAALLGERRKGAAADSAKLRALEQSFKDAQEAARALVVTEQFSKVIEGAGGADLNAFTADDITAYYYKMPSNRLELWALLEGGRMASPVFREFYKERDVVIEERRMRIESSPLGRLYEKFLETAYTVHPYRFGIGTPEDLRTFSRPEGEEFFRTHYVAKNMAIGIVGDVTLADVRALAEKYLSGISDAPKPPPVAVQEPTQTEERRVVLEDPAQPFIMIGWHIPPAADPAYPAYRALASLLTGGDFARLKKSLVKEKKILTNLNSGPGLPGERYPNLFAMLATPAAGQDPKQAEQEIYAALDEIAASKPFTEEELTGYKVRMKAAKIGAVEDNENLAGELAQAQIQWGDWREFFREQERVQALTVTDVMSAMKRSLVKNNRTVAMIVNPSASDGGGH